MAARFTGNEYTLTGSTVTLTTALGLSTPIFFSHGTIRANRSNANDVYIGSSNLTGAANRFGFISAGEAFEVALEGVFISSNEVYIVGTAAEKVHITVVI